MPKNENSTKNEEPESWEDRTPLGAVGPNFANGGGIGGQPFAKDMDDLFDRVYGDVDWGKAAPNIIAFPFPFGWTLILTMGALFLALSVGAVLFFIFGNKGEYWESVSLEIASACFFFASGPVVARWARARFWLTTVITLPVGIGLLWWGSIVSNKLQSALIEFGVATLMLVILELSFSPIWKKVMRKLTPSAGSGVK